MTLYAFILAGGRGERLWPLSTARHPKQFSAIFGGKPLIAHAVDRLEGLVPSTRIFILTAPDLLPATAFVLGDLPPANIIGEPEQKDTAAAVALACGLIRQRDPEGVVAFLTADQLITETDHFRTVLSEAAHLASTQSLLVTLGIAPTYPATRYGYIECGEALSLAEASVPFHKVRRFVEKPTEEKAAAYLETGAFLWNSGMFIGSVATWETAFRTHAPDWLPLLLRPEDASTLYPSLPKLSIDYALMEKCDNLAVASADIGWDDVGTLTAIANHLQPDQHGNCALSPVFTANSKNNLVLAEGDRRTTALLDVNDLVVVHTENVTLVCSKAAAQNLKPLLGELPEHLR